MREHIESLIIAVGGALHATERRVAAPAEPRRRRPRVARSTYVPVRRDLVAPRLAH